MDEPQPLIRVEPGFEERWPGASSLAAECILNLWALNEQIEAFGRALVLRNGLPSMAAFNVLTILHGAGDPLPPSVIAARMIVTRPTMTGILHTLTQRDLVRRSTHEVDRRMALIEITSAGSSLVDRLRPAIHAAERDWMARLSEQEQRSLLRMLARLQRGCEP